VTRTPGNPDDGRLEAIADALVSAYRDSQYHYVQFLTEHLADCSAAFGGDLDSVLILAILGQRRLEVMRAETDRPSEPHRDAMSVLRIADVSGIPRETVRRKLEGLRGKGWVQKHPRFGWYIVGDDLSSPAREALKELEARSFRRLARLHLRLAEILGRDTGTG
jgi:hypothetical protein